MDVEKRRKSYLPNKIKVLFVAEAKPDADDRFFYYDKVRTDDHLYLHLMYALYDKTKEDLKYLREHKEEFLNRFKKDGYYLVDAVDEIATGTKPQLKDIQANAESKIAELHALVSQHGDRDTKVVLIKSTVHDGLYDLMKDEFNIVNDFKVHFPSTGQQTAFLEQMKKVVVELRK